MPARLAAALAALLLASCSESTSDPGEEQPHLQEVAVADGARAVPVDATLLFTLPDGTAPASFAAGNVTLRGDTNNGPQVRALRATLDGGTLVLRITPDRALTRESGYLLSIEGLTNGGGASLGTVTFGFRTVMNPTRREYRPKDDPPTGYAMNLGWRTEWDRDAEGFMLGSSRYYSRGPDGRWLTADDPLVGYTVITGVPTPLGTTDGEQFVGAGPDGIWRTGDDLLAVRWTNVHDPHLHALRQLAQHAGIDGVIDTGDDPFTCTELVEDAQGRLTGQATCKPGEDGVYFTEDDTRDVKATWSRNAADEVSEWRSYAPGLDGQYGTPDDKVYQVVVYERSPGRILYRKVYAGADGLYPSADDVFQSLEADDLDARGKVLRHTAFIGEGADGVAGTADDEPYYGTRYTYDDLGNLVASRFAYIGSDGKLYTPDDDVRSDVEYFTDR